MIFLSLQVALGGDRFTTPFVPAYVESIWVPLDPVEVRDNTGDDDDDDDGGSGSGGGVQLTRVADGLGGLTVFGRGAFHFLAHPDLFSLPSDDVVPGQRRAAIDCVLLVLAAQGLPSDVFSDFGVR